MWTGAGGKGRGVDSPPGAVADGAELKCVNATGDKLPPAGPGTSFYSQPATRLSSLLAPVLSRSPLDNTDHIGRRGGLIPPPSMLLR